MTQTQDITNPHDQTTVSVEHARLPVDAVMLRPDIYEQFGMPEYKTAGSAGIDLRACVDEIVDLEPGKSR